MPAERRAHWLRPNAAARMPRRVIYFDTESMRQRQVGLEEHNFRLGVACCDRLDAQAVPIGEPRWLETEDHAELWKWIAALTNRNHRTVVFAHNLSFDLRLSHGLRHLPKLGFEVRGIGLNSYSCWVRLRRDRHTLWLCDSLSFVPAALEQIAPLVRLEKPPLPADTDDTVTWMARCRADVEVTREMMLRVLRYLKNENLGDFRLTGSAMATAGYRHRFMPHDTLLVHDNEEALAAERRAAWTGRAEVWRHGETAETLHEYDYQYAYARIAHNTEVPYRLECEHSPIQPSERAAILKTQAVLSECIVRTEAPSVPTEFAEHIVWPIGEFRTTLWDNEVTLALESGAEVEVTRNWFYKRGPILRDWAAWILSEMEKPEYALDPVIRLMLKDWSRAVIGRFGLRYPALEEIGRVPSYDLSHRGVWDMDESRELTYIQLGQQLFEQTDKLESSDSMPAIMSYVMAEQRCKLWGLLSETRHECIYYVDTDGIIIDRHAARDIERVIGNGAFPGLRHKRSYAGANLRAPRNIDLGELRRVNGAPRKAERLASGIYRGEVWESLPAALRRQRADKVFVHEREFHISDNDPRRLHLPGGATAPLRLRLEGEENILADCLTAA